MTATNHTCDPATPADIERLIKSGVLSPGARSMTPADAAHQHNEANALGSGDPDYLCPHCARPAGTTR